MVFGSPVSGRPADLPGVETMIGLFINTLPVRVGAHPTRSFADVLAALDRDHTVTREHQQLGLAEIHQVTGLPELFDTLLTVENYPLGTEIFDDLPGIPRVTGVHAKDATNYPLNATALPGETIRISLAHRTDAFSTEEIAAIMDRWRHLIAVVVADPTVPLGRIDVLPAGERHRVLHDFNATGAVEVAVATVPERFAAVVAHDPDKVAVVCEGETRTYAELDADSNRLARALIEAGAGAENAVAILLPRSIDMVVTVLAVLKSGAAYLPLDPGYPPDRLAYTIADAGAVVAVTTPGGSGHGVPVLDPGHCAVARHSAAPVTDADRRVPMHPEHPAWVIYTSGSTGRPKGVVVSQASAVSYLDVCRDVYSRSAGTTAFFGNIAFDLSIPAYLGTLTSGGRLLVCPNDDLAAPETLPHLREATFLKITPSHLRAYGPAVWDEVRDCDIVVGGEALTADLLGQIVGNGRRVINEYGPTERPSAASSTRPVPATAPPPARSRSAARSPARWSTFSTPTFNRCRPVCPVSST